MTKISYRFATASTDYYPDSSFGQLKKIIPRNNTVLVTDENIYRAHGSRFRGWNCIVLKAGEDFKVQATADAVIRKLIDMEAGRDTVLAGVGGGVVTDLTGYVASVYMRGIRFGFLPTSLLAMVDASVGGKNGIDVDVYKNMVGLIRQPEFILQDLGFLESLPLTEWINGFAEIIKHACIRDRTMFQELESGSLESFQRRRKSLSALVQKNVKLKTTLVRKDEFEKGERRLLNFGHSLGHALENQYELSHGQAISIGMTYASHFSERLTGFREPERVIALLEQYGLPTYAGFNRKKIFSVIKMDKKRVRKELNYVLLERIGKAVVRPVRLADLEKFILDL